MVVTEGRRLTQSVPMLLLLYLGLVLSCDPVKPCLHFINSMDIFVPKYIALQLLPWKLVCQQLDHMIVFLEC